MDILALNCGSSSLKYQLFDWKKKEVIAKGLVERVTIGDSFIVHEVPGRETYREEYECPDHQVAINLIIKTLTDPVHGVVKDMKQISAVGHRVVHGGEKFTCSVLIDDTVLNAIKEVQHLAPLHNPPNIAGIEAAKAVLPDAPHIAIFDTAFHQTMPQHAYTYALPYEWYEKYGVRRYGFHGTSVAYVGRRAAELLGKPFEQANLIVLHLGNGASVTAVGNGRSIDTSMGMTPLEGLIMGTRCGDLDPDVPFYLMRHTALSADQTEELLFHGSGLRGLAGVGDMRELHALAQQGNGNAELALQMTAYRLKKYIGAYSAALGRVDAIVFTAGIGENDPDLRARACGELNNLGIVLDHERNATPAATARDIAAAASPVRILVIPTDEEWEIARATRVCLQR